jgi:streptogramin lyase
MKPLLLLLCAAAAMLAQRSPQADASAVSQLRLDLRDLGYPPLDVIPPDDSAIRALAAGPDGVLYGATTGTQSYLFRLDPLHGYVQPLGRLPGVTTVHHALAISREGDVYIGAGNTGHLLKYTPSEMPTADCAVTDLGIAREGEGIYNLALDRDNGVLYGLTSPNGFFFSYRLTGGKPQVFGQVAEHNAPGEKFANEKALGRAMIVDRQGNVFTSGEGGHLYRFDRLKQQLTRLTGTVPTVPGREPFNRVDAWTLDGNGVLYGGSSDGYLFRLQPESLTVENLGKPLNQYRIRGLVFARNGKIYGVGGDDDEMARLFSYDPQHGTYEMLGFLDVNRRPYYAWRAYLVDAMAIGLDGTVYLGQSERKSRLFLYYPE